MLRHYAAPLSYKAVVLHYLHQESDNRFLLRRSLCVVSGLFAVFPSY